MFQGLIGRTVEAYIDDMIIKSKVAHNHIQDIEECFAIFRKYQMKLNPQKYVFGVSSG